MILRWQGRFRMLLLHFFPDLIIFALSLSLSLSLTGSQFRKIVIVRIGKDVREAPISSVSPQSQPSHRPIQSTFKKGGHSNDAAIVGSKKDMYVLMKYLMIHKYLGETFCSKLPILRRNRRQWLFQNDVDIFLFLRNEAKLLLAANEP